MRRLVYFMFMALGVFSTGLVAPQDSKSVTETQISKDTQTTNNAYFSDALAQAKSEELVATHYSHRSHSSHSSHQSSRF